MREVLEKLLRDVPYNSFTAFLHAAGQKFNPAIGGDCVRQNGDLASALAEEGLRTRFVSAVTPYGFQHFASVADDGRKSFYLDPFLLQTEPASLDMVFRKGKVIVDALPFQDGNPSKIVLSAQSKSMFCVQLYRPNCNTYVLVHTYEFDKADIHYELPPPHAPELRRPQQRLSLRKLCEDDSITFLDIFPETGRLYIRQVVEGETTNLRQKTNPKSMYAALEKLAEQLGCGSHEIMHPMFKSLEIYHNQYTDSRPWVSPEPILE